MKSETIAPKIDWDHSHEAKVQKFYGTGVERYGDYHGGYLNFGLWDDGITEYVKAAENLVSFMGNMLGLNKESYLLDVGCGMGAQDIFLHKTFGCKIQAVDVTWGHVLHTRRRIEAAQLDDEVKVMHGTATELPFPDNSFTHLVSIEAPEHFNTREKFFKEAMRVLKPGGVMVLADYSLQHEPRRFWGKFIIKTVAKLWHVPKENYDTKESYEGKLYANGFLNCSILEVGKKVIPGYYFEQRRKETRQAIRKIRGWIAAYPGHLIDIGVYKAFQYGLIEYIIVRAEKTADNG